MLSLFKFVKENINLNLTDFIFERRIINFGGANPNYNQCVILAGGAASGKGTIQGKIDLNAKVLDVDELKQMYRELAKNKKIDDKEAEDWDFADSKHTAQAHSKVKDKKWKLKQRLYLKFGNSHKKAKDHLPNLIFDMVCGDIEDVKETTEYAKEMGYTVTLVWVVTNKDTAIVNNATRGIDKRDKRRKVPDSILEKGHKNAYKTMVDLFSNKYPEISKMIDFAWIGWGTGIGHKMEKKYIDSPVDKIKKNNKGEWQFNKSEVDEFLSKEQPINWDFLDKMKNGDVKGDNEDKENAKERFKKICELNDEVRKHYYE